VAVLEYGQLFLDRAMGEKGVGRVGQPIEMETAG
jgi:hypothetical protein